MICEGRRGPTWLRSASAPFIAELIIGHPQKGVHKVYDVHRYQAEKRKALERWANRLRDIVTPPPANVRRLRVAADA